MRISDIAFLCGYFTAEGTPTNDIGWTCERNMEEGEAILRDFYFPEFVDFHTKEVRKFSIPINKETKIQLRSGTVLSFKVEKLLLWMMPSSLAVFAIKIIFENEMVDAVTEALSVLRNSSYFGTASINNFIETAIAPIAKTYSALGGKVSSNPDSFEYLVENGNKLKIFQIASSSECPEDYNVRNRLLYSLGTVSRYEASEPFSVDPRYYEKVMNDHRLGVFSSWTALALLDTVTFLGKDVADHQKEIWEDDYFGLIYVYEIFRKSFLYRQNLFFRARAKNPVLLQDELAEFERKYTFTSISYNFLPVEVDTAIVKGLDLRKEEESLSRLVAKEASAREEASTGKRNRFLLFLTYLASMSAVWDISCLLDEVINYEHTFQVSNWGYRLFSTLVIFCIALFAWRTSRKKR